MKKPQFGVVYSLENCFFLGCQYIILCGLCYEGLLDGSSILLTWPRCRCKLITSSTSTLTPEPWSNDLGPSSLTSAHICSCSSLMNFSPNDPGDGLTDSLRGLSSTEVKSVVDWRDFYVRTYIPVGKLVGLYYNSKGNPTKYLKGVEAKAARGAQLMEKQKVEEAKVPSCNSRWSQEDGSEVWCDNGYPRLVQRPLEIALTGKMSKRCACFKKDELDGPGLEVYEGCEYFSSLCRL